MPREPWLYWDWNATTPPHADVLLAMQRAYAESWGNSSSPHQVGRTARACIEDARERIARLVGFDARDVLFAANGTEANNLALSAASGLVVSRLDHPSIVRVAESLAARGRPVVWVAVPETGRLDAAQVLAAVQVIPELARSRAVVALTAANHETGVVQPVAELARALRGSGLRLHVDAAQALGKLPFENFAGADSYTLVAHKIRGPQGIAALAWKGWVPEPVLLGGSQERGLRPGTQSAPLVAGFAAALERIDPSRYARLEPLRDQLERELAPYSSVNGAGTARLPHVSNLSFQGWSGERLVAALDVRGLCVSTGSACRVGTTEPSAAVLAMLGAERARAALRISFGEDLDEAQLRAGIAVLLPVLEAQLSKSTR